MSTPSTGADADQIWIGLLHFEPVTPADYIGGFAHVAAQASSPDEFLATVGAEALSNGWRLTEVKWVMQSSELEDWQRSSEGLGPVLEDVESGRPSMGTFHVYDSIDGD